MKRKTAKEGLSRSDDTHKKARWKGEGKEPGLAGSKKVLKGWWETLTTTGLYLVKRVREVQGKTQGRAMRMGNANLQKTEVRKLSEEENHRRLLKINGTEKVL